MMVTALLVAAATPDDRWVRVAGSPTSQEEHVDTQSIKRDGDIVTLWTRRNLGRGQGTAWNELELDCGMRTQTILAYIRDDGRSVSHNSVRPHRAASPIPRDSVEDRIFNIACR